MYTILKKKDHEAIIFLPEYEINETTRKQVYQMMDNLACPKIRCMPDAHAGAGCCVGLTSEVSLSPFRVVPDFIGVDIGCGVLAHELSTALSESMRDRQNVIKFEEIIKKTIVTGSKVNERGTYDVQSLLSNAFEASTREAQGFCSKYGFSGAPRYNDPWLREKCKQISVDYDYVLSSIGTLGGGNHFIECNVSDDTGKCFIFVHSGSRNFGFKVCKYHQDVMKGKSRESSRASQRKAVDDVKRKHKGLKGVALGEKVKEAQRVCQTSQMGQKEPDFLEGEGALQYVFDMIFAQNYAKINRRLMIQAMLKKMSEAFNEAACIESVHNYIDFSNCIMRKGAISASEGELCWIPLNMRDGTLLCRGLGNSNWNHSAPHGAGRIFSRSEAKGIFDLSQFQEEMRGVYTTSVCQSTIDEAPFVYKDKDLIQSMITGEDSDLGATVEIIECLRPIFNIKDCPGTTLANDAQTENE